MKKSIITLILAVMLIGTGFSTVANQLKNQENEFNDIKKN
mgnify:FL=1